MRNGGTTRVLQAVLRKCTPGSSNAPGTATLVAPVVETADRGERGDVGTRVPCQSSWSRIFNCAHPRAPSPCSVGCMGLVG